MDSYDLQLIDCNCNNCIFMDRDLDLYKKWEQYHKEIQLEEFNKSKEKAIFEASQVPGDSGKGMLRVAEKMRFQFEKKYLIQYGTCNKFKKPVTFIPGTCLIETQQCFKHRRDNNDVRNGGQDPAGDRSGL